MSTLKQSVRRELYRDISIHLLEQLEHDDTIPTPLSDEGKARINLLLEETIDAIGETVSEQSFTINNDGEEQEHTLYALDGDPLRTLDCPCENCINYFCNQ